MTGKKKMGRVKSEVMWMVPRSPHENPNYAGSVWRDKEIAKYIAGLARIVRVRITELPARKSRGKKL